MSRMAEERQQYQLDFLASGQEIEVGSLEKLPICIADLKAVTKDSEFVVKYFSGGLTAEVFKLQVGGRYYTLKKKREQILVQNIDGQTSFLNEVQRRRDFEILKRKDKDAFEGIVNTIYASVKHGVIISPWIEGEEIAKYDACIIDKIFRNLINMERGGIFEWDPTSGNMLLDEHKNVMMYDFGYAYPVDPRKDYNSDGNESPVFHCAERFETRAFMQHLMDIEQIVGLEKALELFRTEKDVALKHYREKLSWLSENNGIEPVKAFINGFIMLWEEGLKSDESLKRLYKLESFRSYVIDVHDDLSGKSCNPDTLKKVAKAINIIEDDFQFLKGNNALFWGDEKLSQNELVERYKKYESDVLKYQLKNRDRCYDWRERRLRKIKQNYA